jgi:flagellum-specific peptidoglycan hydrolase FlgJ
VRSARKPWWQQATALVTVSTGGVITGLNFVPGAAATMTSPTSVPLHLLALEQAAQPGTFTDLAVGGDGGAVSGAARVTSDAQLRAAIVNVAGYYLRLAKTRTPAQMEALIWDKTSSDGADHGPSCAAFASLTLELAAQAVGQQSWVTGGDTYPWPLPEWADVRVETNTASPGITSMVADAQAHARWHPLGDRYQPQPGDWAVYDGHVEVVTSYADGVLDTIGADSLPALTVNAHSSVASLADQGVVGFVDNGNLKPASGGPAPAPSAPTDGKSGTGNPAPETTTPQPAASGRPDSGSAGSQSTDSRSTGSASPAIPGVLAAGDLLGHAAAGTGSSPGHVKHSTSPDSTASIPGLGGVSVFDGTVSGGTVFGGTTFGGTKGTVSRGAPDIPGAVPAASPAQSPAVRAAATPSATPTVAPTSAPRSTDPVATRPTATQATPTQGASSASAAAPGTRDQQAFINLVAPGAMAAQQRLGVPAAVTIAQAIEESSWGRSGLAAQYHNLFGIKGTGPAGSVNLPTSEFQGGQWVTIDAPFRVYHNDAESIADHAELLATSGYYTRAMADRAVPDAFANDLTGVYATDPGYGANLIALMKLYNLYQFDSSSGSAQASAPSGAPTHTPAWTPTATATPTASATPTPSATPTASATQAPTPTSTGAVIPGVTGDIPTGAASAPTGQPAPTPVTTPAGPSRYPGTGQHEHPGNGPASVPGVAAPALAPSAPAAASVPGPAAAGTGVSGHIPGLVAPAQLSPTAASPAPGRVTPGRTTPADRSSTGSAATVLPGGGTPAAAGGGRIPGLAPPVTTSRSVATATPARSAPRRGAAQVPGVPTGSGIVTTGLVTTGRITRVPPAKGPIRYQAQLPQAVTTALFVNAKAPLARSEHLYRDVAACTGVSWELLAAVDWMQCKADPRYSPVHGEKIGSLNGDGTSYPTKSAALTQCACDLIELTAAVYGIDLTVRRRLSVRELANAFAAFRWGAILRRHGVSAMEFPYSVSGLTTQHQKMHWPSIEAPDAPDRPGARFRAPFGAVPVVLSLNYPATV